MSSADALPCPPRLLLVDDEPASLLVLNEILARTDARLFFATSGEDALEQVERHKPDLVLLDAGMPGLGGFELCARLKADPLTADMPVIFVTARTDTGSETRALDLGAADFIHKPVNPPVVLARVRTQLALKRQADELRRLTTTDALTGLTNRRGFDERLRSEWRRAMRTRAPLSLLLIDIDHFKHYNDRYGHPAGDDCLRRVGQVIADSIQREGDVAARYGGEEFAVVLPGVLPRDALGVAERLCARLRGLAIEHAASPVAPRLTLSVGAASLRVPCEPAGCDARSCRACERLEPCTDAAKDLLALADRALYAAKDQGRDRAVGLVGVPDFPAP